MAVGLRALSASVVKHSPRSHEAHGEETRRGNVFSGGCRRSKVLRLWSAVCRCGAAARLRALSASVVKHSPRSRGAHGGGNYRFLLKIEKGHTGATPTPLRKYCIDCRNSTPRAQGIKSGLSRTASGGTSSKISRQPGRPCRTAAAAVSRGGK